MPHLKLQDAFLCIDCETIGSDPRECVVCLSHAVHSVAGFLNRTRPTETMVELVDRVTGWEPLPLGWMPEVEDGRG